MTEIRRYLAEEVAEDHADGIITRREAIRRLGLLGVTGAAATGLLATFATGAAAASETPADQDGRRAALETTWAPVARESITFPGPRVPLMAAWAAAAKPRGGVLVIHENRGLNEHIRTVAGRLAASGYSALALDLLSEEGGTGAFPGEVEVAAALAQIPPERFVADMKASVTELKRRVRGEKLTAIGFCFGGAMVWRLLASNEPRLAAAAPFYGPFPEGGNLEGSRAAVLGVYGGLDSRVNATRPAGPMFRGRGLVRLEQVNQVLRDVAQRHNATPSQVALRWLIRQDNVVPIPGAKNGRQAAEDAGGPVVRAERIRDGRVVARCSNCSARGSDW